MSTLSSKLRKQAVEGRADTVTLAQSVNEMQARMKEATRKLKALVSELSMYQATGLKLGEEADALRAEVAAARERLEHGEPPSEGVEREWARKQRDELRARETAVLRDAAKGAAAAGGARTTAEPRPNAYVPHDLGIPRPYGGSAPFKPTATGATMRHFRRPRERLVEI